MGKIISRVLVALLACTVLAACGFIPDAPDPHAVFEDEEVYRTADVLLETIARKDAPAFEANMVDELYSNPSRRAIQEALFKNYPADASAKLVFAEELKQPGAGPRASLYVLVYEVVSGRDIFGITLTMVQLDSGFYRLAGLSVDPLEYRLSTGLDLTFADKGAPHYLVAALAIALPVFMIVTAVACFRNPDIRNRWLWIPFILIGLWGVEFDWASGDFAFVMFGFGEGGYWYVNFFSFQLLGVSLLKATQLSPWILTLGFPVGAVAYWFRARKLSEAISPEDALS